MLAMLLVVAVVTERATRLWAQSDEAPTVSREYAIKAAYLYQFGRYVQWPAAQAHAEAPFVIGILGADPFGNVLDEIAREKKVEGRSIVVRRFASMTDYVPCHLLFVPAAASAAIRRAQSAPLLLVGETPGFAQQGGVINFYLEENRIRFEINAEAAKRHQLKISSKLLNLAKIVGTDQSRQEPCRPTPWALARLDSIGGEIRGVCPEFLAVRGGGLQPVILSAAKDVASHRTAAQILRCAQDDVSPRTLVTPDSRLKNDNLSYTHSNAIPY